MTDFNWDSLVSNLPDTFRQDENSNNYKLFLVEQYIYKKIHDMLQSVFNILDIDNATGKTLDEYGERLNLKRGKLTDLQYLIQLKAKIAQSLCDGSRDSVVKALAYVLSSTTDKMKLVEGDKKNTIKIKDIPLTLLFEAGFTADQITAMIEELLPVGVHVSQAEFSGTFEFGQSENEQDNTKGFADESGTIGGYFGLLNVEEV